MQQSQFTSEERLAWEMLYRTIQDAYKIATGNTSHFSEMRWAKTHQKKQILDAARNDLIAWLENDAFAYYSWVHGWKPEQAVDGVWRILNGEADLEKVKELLREIWRIRNARSKVQTANFFRPLETLKQKKTF